MKSKKHMIVKENCPKAVYEIWNRNLESDLNYKTKFGMKTISYNKID